MDIKRIVQENEMHKNKNTWAFEPGDHIVIQIKIDGSNASVRYDPETGKACGVLQKAADREDKGCRRDIKISRLCGYTGRGEVSEVSRLCIFRGMR